MIEDFVRNLFEKKNTYEYGKGCTGHSFLCFNYKQVICDNVFNRFII